MAHDLPALVQVLPTELYDEIFRLTVLAIASISFLESRWRRTIDKKYKPPALLHLDKNARDVFANRFYGTTPTFYISGALAVKWIQNLPGCHLGLIKDIKILDVRAYLRYGRDLLGYGGLVGRPKFTLRVDDMESDRDERVVLSDPECISVSMELNVLKVKLEPGAHDEDWTAWMRFSDAMHDVM